MAVIQGEKLVLVPAQLTDEANLLNWRNHEQVFNHLFGNERYDAYTFHELYKTDLNNPYNRQFIIKDKSLDEEIGTIFLRHIHPINQKAEIGYYLNPDFIGKGYGTEAIRLMVNYGFETLKLHKIYMQAFKNNKASIRCCEKIGFVQEGVHKDEIWKNGEFRDVVTMALSKPEMIPVSGPSITEKEVAYVVEAVKHGWYENANKFQEQFEENFRAYVGRKYAIALPSCTAAIHLALCAIGISEGDEVIVPDITWIATAAPISYVGARPVFADIDPKSWCISEKAIKDRITVKTKAIIAVDLYGNIPHMEELEALSKAYHIPLIEDAAQAMGSTYKGRRAGSFGDISVFSFHGSKIMTTGEGGMLVTDSKDLYERVLKLRDHGRAQGPKMFWNDEIAYKYKMSSMQAALGTAQLERIEELVGFRRQLFSKYAACLKDVEGIRLNEVEAYITSNYWMITLVWDEKFSFSKEDVIKALADQKIAARPFFYPLSMEPAYKGMTRGEDYENSNKNAYSIAKRGINLPSGMNMNKELVTYVCEKVREVFKGCNVTT